MNLCDNIVKVDAGEPYHPKFSVEKASPVLETFSGPPNSTSTDRASVFQNQLNDHIYLPFLDKVSLRSSVSSSICTSRTPHVSWGAPLIQPKSVSLSRQSFTHRKKSLLKWAGGKSAAKKELSSEDSLKVCCMNANSLVSNAKSNLLKVWSAFHLPDVICITESKLSPDIIDSEFLPNGYHVCRKDRHVSDGGGGVCVLVRDGVKHSPIELTEANETTEIVGIKVELDGLNVLVFSYYRPRLTDRTSLEDFLSIMKIVTSTKPTPDDIVLVYGDFNTPDYGAPNQSCLTRTLVDGMHELFLDQVVNFPSRQGHFLDHIYTSHPDKTVEVQPIDGISDHDGISLLVRVSVGFATPVKLPPTLIYKDADWIAITSQIADHLGDYDPSVSVESNWQHLKNVMMTAVKKHTPVKSGPLIPKKHGDAFSQPHIKAIFRKKERAFKKARRSTSTQSDSNILRTLRKKLKKKLKKFKKKMDLRVSTDLSDHRRKFYRYVKSKSLKPFGLPDLVDGDQVITDDLQKSEIMGTFFQSVQTREPEIVDGEAVIYGPSLKPVPQIVIEPNGVYKLLVGLKTNKSGGCDGISPLVWKQTAPVVYIFLAALFSESYETGELPTDWKKSRVHPIHKKGKRSDKSNYRPISLTCIACKIFEHIVHSHVMKHMILHSIIDDRQHGFRPGHSCETQILSILEHWTSSLDVRSEVVAILLDFSKAFDSVPHERLLLKLQHYGVSGKLLEWIRSFLVGRTQFVSLNGTDSTPLPVQSGVPQGSVLGPLLFLLFINDISSGVDSPVHLFADDSILFRSIKSDDDILALQRDLVTLNEWSSHWLLKFNASKSQQITIRQGTNHYVNPVLTLGDVVLSTFGEVTYLGVVLDDHLRWNSHINKICTAANTKIGFLRRHFSGFCQEAKILLYNSYVLSRLEYCAAAWDPYTQANINQLERVHNKGVRFITGHYSWFESVTRLREAVGLSTLAERRKAIRIDRLGKFLKDELPISYASRPPLLSERHGAATRQQTLHAGTLNEDQLNTRIDCRKYSFLPRTVRDFNASLS